MMCYYARVDQHQIVTREAHKGCGQGRRHSAWAEMAGWLLLQLLLNSMLQHSAQAARIQQTATEVVAATAAAAATRLHLPHDPIFDDPWVQSNIAVTYSHKVQDGIGSQTLRLLSVYALAQTTGVQHLFRPVICVGHIGSQTFYHTADCAHQNTTTQRLMEKARRMIDLPSTITENEVSKWHQRDLMWGPPMGMATWDVFVRAVTAAFEQKRPTLFLVKSLVDTVRDYPDMFYTIPQLKPMQPLPPLQCRQRAPSPQLLITDPAHKKAWLLDALRIAVHIRRGDIKSQKIILPAEYYINVVNSIAKVLDQSQCDYAVEVYIEASPNPQHVQELKVLRSSIPNVVLLVDTDMLWSWQQMATADILVMSNSMFSSSAALLNPNAVVVHVPEERFRGRTGQFLMKHWMYAQTDQGALPSAAIQQIKDRLGTH